MAAMIVRLSHTLSANTPFYEGLEKPRVESLYELSRGDECNSFYVHTSNHCGTHVDAPWHFNPPGRRIAEYEADELTFSCPAIVDVPVTTEQLIVPDDLQVLASVRRDCDILLLRTGYGKYRSDARKYVEDGPGFSRAAAEHVLDALPEVRALIMDFVSVSALKHPAEGADAHRVFLGCPGYSRRTVLLVEDAYLPGALTTPARILLAPWMIEGIDSAPCTVLAEFP